MAPSSGEWQVEKLFTKEQSDRMTIDVPGVVDPVKLRVPKRSLMVNEILISMRLFLEVVQNNNGTDEIGTLYFEFGPSGTQFDPHVILKIPFELLLTEQMLEPFLSLTCQLFLSLRDLLRSVIFEWVLFY